MGRRCGDLNIRLCNVPDKDYLSNAPCDTGHDLNNHASQRVFQEKGRRKTHGTLNHVYRTPQMFHTGQVTQQEDQIQSRLAPVFQRHRIGIAAHARENVFVCGERMPCDARYFLRSYDDGLRIQTRSVAMDTEERSSHAMSHGFSSLLHKLQCAFQSTGPFRFQEPWKTIPQRVPALPGRYLPGDHANQQE